MASGASDARWPRSSSARRVSGVRISLLSLQDEAFTLWQTHWGNLYPPGSKSQKMIAHFLNTYYLVNLVDNDYVQGNILFQVVNDVLERMGKPRRPKTPPPMTREGDDNPQT